MVDTRVSWMVALWAGSMALGKAANLVTLVVVLTAVQMACLTDSWMVGGLGSAKVELLAE